MNTTTIINSTVANTETAEIVKNDTMELVNMASNAASEQAEQATEETRASYKVEFESVPYSELVNRDIIRPNYQREYVWDAKHQAAWEDTVTKNLPAPAIILAAIPHGESEAYLLVDGLQRTTTHKLNRARYEDILKASPEDDKALDRLVMYDDYMINIMTIHCESVAESAELFVRYNNGQALTAVQRDAAKLDSKRLEKIKEWKEFTNSFGVEKFYKTTPDTVAFMLAASVTNPLKISSSSATASKVLQDANAEDIVTPCESTNRLVKYVLDEIKGEAIKDGVYRYADWLTPARFIPLYFAVDTIAADISNEYQKKGKEGPSMEVIGKFISTQLIQLDPKAKEKYTIGIPKISRKKADKGQIVKDPVTVSVAEAFASTSNAYKATITRQLVIYGYLAKAYNKLVKASKAAEPTPEEIAEKAAVQASVAAIDSIINGLTGGEG